LYEQTYQALRTAILSGELATGTRLIETQIATALQISRTPVREALRQLQQEGLVVADENGLRVTILSVEDANQLYDCRIALEQLSVSAACQNASSEQLSKLTQLVQKAEKIFEQPQHGLTPYQLLDMDYQFHRTIAQSSGNQWLVSLLDQVFDKMALLRIRTTQHNPRVLEIRQEHRRICQAICDRDTAIAVAAIRNHLMESKTRVLSEIQQLPQI
jgi:DNA-binding GntR family transcriptional regulator